MLSGVPWSCNSWRHLAQVLWCYGPVVCSSGAPWSCVLLRSVISRIVSRYLLPTTYYLIPTNIRLYQALNIGFYQALKETMMKK